MKKERKREMKAGNLKTNEIRKLKMANSVKTTSNEKQNRSFIIEYKFLTICHKWRN